MSFRATFRWQDTGQRQRITECNSLLGAVNLIPVIIPCSNADLINLWDGILNRASGSGTLGNGPDDVGYMAMWDMADALGDHARLYWPAPIGPIFLPDGQTIDGASPQMVILTAAMVLECVVPQVGGPVSAGGPGWVTRRGSAIRDFLTVAPIPGAFWGSSLVWLDGHGNTTQTCVVADTPPLLTVGALTVVSNCFLMEQWTGQIQFPGVGPTVGNYQTVMDALNITYIDSTGNRGTLVIPAPKSALFYADGETFDPYSALGAPLVATMLTDMVVSSTGNLCTRVLGGRRMPYTTQLGI